MSQDWRNPERVVPWKPRQQFRLTPGGSDAIERYREVVNSAQQAVDPRPALERAMEEWATTLKLRAADGILLEDLATGHTSLAEMGETLRACNLTLRDARGTLDRLIAAHLIEPLETPGVAGRDWDSRTRA